MSAIGRRIRARRDELGLTQAELAEKAGLGRSSIAQYERGRTRPRAGELEALARSMDLSVDELLTGRKSGASGGYLESGHLEPEQEALGNLLQHPLFSSKVRKTFHEFLMAFEKELMTPPEQRSVVGAFGMREPGKKFNQTPSALLTQGELLKEFGKAVFSSQEEGVKPTALLTLKAAPKGTSFKSGQVLLIEDAPDVDSAPEDIWFLVSLRGRVHFARKNPKEGIQGFVNAEGLSLSNKCQVIGAIAAVFPGK